MGYFRVGDIIKGVKDNPYSTTDEEMTKGEVISVYDKENEMEIKVLKHSDDYCIGDTFNVENSKKYFELVHRKTPTWQELLKMPIGTKIITNEKKDNIYLKINDNSWVNNNEDYICDYNINEDLTVDYFSENEKIIEIEEPTYTSVYSRTENKKEMTIAEIEKELGYSIKIVKEEK